MSESIYYYEQEIQLRKEMIDFLNAKLVEIGDLKILFSKAQKYEECARFRDCEKATLAFIELLGGIIEDE
jgi:hypothetical protein